MTPVFENQMDLFKWLWDTYPHRCEITFREIKQFSPWNFHHILGKQAYPTYKLYAPNILICHPEVHHAIETANTIPFTNSRGWLVKDRARSEREYAFLKELLSMLKSNYYQKVGNVWQ